MKYFFFDVETTGKILDYKDKNIANHSNFPRIVQIAYIVTDNIGTELVKQEHIIKPNGFIIPNEVIAIHGVSNEIANSKGIDLEIVLKELLLHINYCDTIVCHNVNFDLFVLAAEYSRMQITQPNRKLKICTMETTQEFVGLKNSYGYKFPKLQELHKKLFGSEFDKAHNALADIQATKNCFFELKNNHGFYNN